MLYIDQELFQPPNMSLLRFIVVAGIFMCGTQRHIVCAKTENAGNTWLSIGTNEVFSYFIQHKNHILDVEKISTFLVGLISECSLRCARIVTCLSFNIEEASVNGRAMRCELLAQDQYNAPLQFHESNGFHHWSKIVSRRLFLNINFIFAPSRICKFQTRSKKILGDNFLKSLFY